MSLTPDTKDFLLHLYDKLWENMGSKEGRLWNYLSVYGAAIALTLGVGHYGGIELQSVVLVLALTTWAILIVINANWWYQRNRLMVTQIERRFSEGGQLDGVIPKAYRDAVYGFDRLYRGSVLILSAIALLLYLRSMWLRHSMATIDDKIAAYSLTGIYVLSVISIMYCTAQNDSYIAAFYSTKKDLLLEWNQNADVHALEEQERQARQHYGWNVYSAIALIYAMGVFDLMPGELTTQRYWLALVAVLLQLASLALFFTILRLPGQSTMRRSWWLRLTVFGLIVASGAMLIRQEIAGLKMAAPKPSDLSAIKQEISGLDSRLSDIQTREADEVERALKTETDKFLTKEEASRTYLPRQQQDQKTTGAPPGSSLNQQQNPAK